VGHSRPQAIALLVVVAATIAAAAEPPAPAAVPVVVEQGDGGATAGLLAAIDAQGVRLTDAGGTAVVLAGERVRRLRRSDADAAAPSGLRPVRVTLVDDSTLTCDDLAWDGGPQAVLVRPEGRIELPASRIAAVAWPGQGDAPSAWQAAIPDGVDKDLVVVGTAEQHEFVECAITRVSADAVTVLLEEETIPVKRSKVIGLQWVRDEARGQSTGGGAAARAVVTVPGGSLRANRVEWSPEALVIDGAIRLPSALLLEVDYAAGRLVPLASLTADTVDVEPWFGGLKRAAGSGDSLATFFAPRTIGPNTGAAARGAGSAGSAVPAIIMRPRTKAVWRLPADSRRFRAVVSAQAAGQTVDAALVSVLIDDREAYRRQVGAGVPAGAAAPDPAGDPAAIDLDVTSGRRLTVIVDFVPGRGIGSGVVVGDAVIER